MAGSSHDNRVHHCRFIYNATIYKPFCDQLWFTPGQIKFVAVRDNPQ